MPEKATGKVTFCGFFCIAEKNSDIWLRMFQNCINMHIFIDFIRKKNIMVSIKHLVWIKKGFANEAYGLY